MIFLDPGKEIPDETVDTQWNMTARVYFDSAISTLGQKGKLTITRVDGIGGSVEKSVDFSKKVGAKNVEEDVQIIVPVSLFQDYSGICRLMHVDFTHMN